MSIAETQMSYEAVLFPSQGSIVEYEQSHMQCRVSRTKPRAHGFQQLYKTKMEGLHTHLEGTPDLGLAGLDDKVNVSLFISGLLGEIPPRLSPKILRYVVIYIIIIQNNYTKFYPQNFASSHKMLS